LKDYCEIEKSENELYENDEEFDYEALDEEMEESQDGSSKNYYIEEVEVADGGGNDAVSFLTGILKHGNEEDKKIVELQKIKKVRQAQSSSDGGFDDPNRRHICNVCNKKFQKRSNLIDHLRLHANMKVFACEHCEKSFVQAGNYKAHLRTHTKEKPVSLICIKMLPIG